MYALNHITVRMTADARRTEMLRTAERKRLARAAALAQHDHGPAGQPHDRGGQRKLTVRRLAMVAGATILATAVATGAYAASQADAADRRLAAAGTLGLGR